MSEPGPSRRAVLAGTAAALVAAGCSTGSSPEPPERVDPDAALRAEVASDVRLLLGLYDATTDAHPSLAARLAPLAAETRAHAEALGGPSPTAAPASPSGTTSAPATGTPTVPGETDAARLLLSRAERSAADDRVRQVAAASPALARLLASIGASEAAHAAALGSAT